MGWERLGTAATHLLDRPPPSLSQVLRTTPRLASVEIVTVGDVPLPAPLAGVIRCAERRGARCAKAGEMKTAKLSAATQRDVQTMVMISVLTRPRVCN